MLAVGCVAELAGSHSTNAVLTHQPFNASMPNLKVHLVQYIVLFAKSDQIFLQIVMGSRHQKAI